MKNIKAFWKIKNNCLWTLLLSMFCCLSSFGANAAAVVTPLGKITWTQGHQSPTCRTVEFTDNTTGGKLYFRIPNQTGPDNGISTTLLAALISNRNVQIYYDPAQTTGCGTEPAIIIVTIF